MSVSETEVDLAYRYILGRYPESREQSLLCKKRFGSLDSLREFLINSKEFDGLKEKSNSQILTTNSKYNSCFVFLHVPKCAGSTVHNMIVSSGNFKDVCRFRFNNFYSVSPNYLGKFDCLSAHIDFRTLNLLIHNNVRVLTTLRDPVDRLVSLYNFLKSHKIEFIKRENLGLALLAKQLSMPDFFQHPAVSVHPSINNTYTRLFSIGHPYVRWEYLPTNPQNVVNEEVDDGCLQQALNNVAKVDVLKITPNFNKKILHYFSNIGINAVSSSNMQVTKDLQSENVNMEKVALEKVNEETTRLLAPLLEYDIKFFKRANEWG